MATSHDFDGTMSVIVTNTGGVSAGDLCVLTGNKMAFLCLTAAASGAACIAKVAGLVRGVTKTSSTGAFVAGDPLTVVSGGTVALATTSSIMNAIAYTVTTSQTTVLTTDIILVPPSRNGT